VHLCVSMRACLCYVLSLYLQIYQFIYDFGNVGFCNFGLLIDLVWCGFQGLRKKIGFSEGC
jgi:hypothetical protein